MTLPKYFTVFCLLAVALVKCVNQPDDQVVKSGTEPNGMDTASISFLRTFSLQISEPMVYDSNSFIFYCRSNYDTSFLIEIKKDRKNCRGVCYQVLPNYHRFMTDFANDTSRLLFFEGYSFVIDSVIWNKLTDKATHLLRISIVSL
jgi:hypothetical protein